MTNRIYLVLIAAIIAVDGGAIPEAITAKARVHKDYITSLYNEVAEVQVSNIYNMLRLYSHGTLEQTQQVVEYIESHSNLTRAESKSLRMASNTSVEISDCVLRCELGLLQSYRTTGYNLHNCIRSAQLGYEKSYVELNTKLDTLKATALRTCAQYHSTLDNCVDNECVMKTLVQAVFRFEQLKDFLGKEITEGNNLNSRYIVTSIAMGCVASSLQQIHNNYNIGKDLMARCFHENKTTQTP